VNTGPVIYYACNYSGTSMLEMATRLSTTAAALENGNIDLTAVARDTEDARGVKPLTFDFLWRRVLAYVD
jgi:hypothetical protein